MPPRTLQVMNQVHGTPLVASRQSTRCTDVVCCLLFLVALLGTGGLGALGFQRGKSNLLERFAIGKDFQGRVCGKDAAVKNFKLTYFTLPVGSGPVASSNWDVLRPQMRPVCTSACPQAVGGAEQNPVYPRQNFEQTLCPPDMADACTWYGGNTTQIALYCVDLAAMPQSRVVGSDLSWLQDIRSSAIVLCAVPVMAILVGFLFLSFVHRLGGICIWASLVFAGALPLALGLLFFMNSKRALTGKETVALLDKLHPSTQRDLAFALWVISLLVAIFAVCFARTIQGIVAVLKATAQFLQDVPSQMLQPILVGLVQLIFFAAWLVIFIQVGSIGVHEEETPVCLKVGNIYCVKWDSNTQWYGLLYLVFMLYWVLNFFHALSHFGTSYAVGEWFFATTDPLTGRKEIDGGRHSFCDCRLSIRAFCQGLLNHPGSLAYGACVVAMARVAKLLIWWAKKDEEARPSNPLTKCVRRCIDCLAECLTRFIEFVSEHAYTELALGSGTSFCEAAKKALAMAVLRPSLFALVGRVACAVRIIGTLLVMACTTSVVGVLLVMIPPAGLQSPTAPILAAAVASFVVGEVMMHPFSAAARGALHCYCLDEDHARSIGMQQPSYTPQPMLRLAETVDDHHAAHSKCCPCMF